MMKDDLKEGGVRIFETMIRRAIGFPHAALRGIPISQASDARAALEDYRQLGKEIEEVFL